MNAIPKELTENQYNDTPKRVSDWNMEFSYIEGDEYNKGSDAPPLYRLYNE